MDREPLQLIRFICTTPLHARGGGDSAFTIHDGAWAFCIAGASAKGHTWETTRGLPISAAMRFAQYRIGDHRVEASTVSAPPRATGLRSRR